MTWIFDDGRPIYTQLVEQVQQAVAGGRYAPGEKLPGVREMAAEAGVNPNTMQRALAELETRGLLAAQRTAGRYVTQDTARIAALKGQLAQEAARRYAASMREIGCTAQEIEQYAKNEAKGEADG